MELTTHNGMVLIKSDDLGHLSALKTLFKQERNTVAIIYQYSKTGKEVISLMSKLWRISDEILDELKAIGEIQ